MLRYTPPMPSALRPLFLSAAIAVTGAGCLRVPASPSVAEPYQSFPSAAEPNRTQGFGDISAILPPQRADGPPVTFRAAIPPAPETMTVLRLPASGPNETETRSMLSALRIPNGAIGALSRADAFVISWANADGAAWTFDANTRYLQFRHAGRVPETKTVAAVLPAERYLDQAATVLSDLGVAAGSYGPPSLKADWASWWRLAQQDGRCMTASILAELRAAEETSPLRTGSFPTLPRRTEAACVTAEFPSETIVSFAGTADGQPVVRTDGTLVSGAEIVLDTRTLQPLRGRLFLNGDPNRSEYAALTRPEIDVRASASVPSNISTPVTVNRLTFGYLARERTLDGIREIVLIPSYVAEGVIDTDDGPRSTTFAVPLIK